MAEKFKPFNVSVWSSKNLKKARVTSKELVYARTP